MVPTPIWIGLLFIVSTSGLLQKSAKETVLLARDNVSNGEDATASIRSCCCKLTEAGPEGCIDFGRWWWAVDRDDKHDSQKKGICCRAVEKTVTQKSISMLAKTKTKKIMLQCDSFYGYTTRIAELTTSITNTHSEDVIIDLRTCETKNKKNEGLDNILGKEVLKLANAKSAIEKLRERYRGKTEVQWTADGEESKSCKKATAPSPTEDTAQIPGCGTAVAKSSLKRQDNFRCQEQFDKMICPPPDKEKPCKTDHKFLFCRTVHRAVCYIQRFQDWFYNSYTDLVDATFLSRNTARVAITPADVVTDNKYKLETPKELDTDVFGTFFDNFVVQPDSIAGTILPGVAFADAGGGIFINSLKLMDLICNSESICKMFMRVIAIATGITSLALALTGAGFPLAYLINGLVNVLVGKLGQPICDEGVTVVFRKLILCPGLKMWEDIGTTIQLYLKTVRDLDDWKKAVATIMYAPLLMLGKIMTLVGKFLANLARGIARAFSSARQMLKTLGRKRGDTNVEDLGKDVKKPELLDEKYRCCEIKTALDTAKSLESAEKEDPELGTLEADATGSGAIAEETKEKAQTSNDWCPPRKDLDAQRAAEDRMPDDNTRAKQAQEAEPAGMPKLTRAQRRIEARKKKRAAKLEEEAKNKPMRAYDEAAEKEAKQADQAASWDKYMRDRQAQEAEDAKL